MITRVAGIRVGHATDLTGITGCTVVLCPPGTAGSVDVKGGAPGTRETDAIRPGTSINEIHAVLLTGGSAFGLAAASGVARWLEEREVGFEAGVVALTSSTICGVSVGVTRSSRASTPRGDRRRARGAGRTRRSD